jgi:hypothetical protein
VAGLAGRAVEGRVETRPLDHDDELEATGAGPTGIGGWLLIPALTLVSVAFATSSSILDQQLASVSLEILAGNALLTVGSVVLLVLFFQRSRHLPGLMVVFYVVLVAVASLEYVAVDRLLLGVTPEIAEQEAKLVNDGIRLSITSAILWIPYFLVSRRVKNTFVC